MADDVLDLGGPTPATPVSNDMGSIDLSSPDAFRSTAARSASSHEPVGVLESLGRGAVEGATFGFDDKLGFDKERREQSRKENPWTHFAGELVGGIAPVVASGGAAAGLRAGATAVPALARGATGLARGIEATMLPGEIGGGLSAAGQGAKLGATYGALSGAGHADVAESDDLLDSAGKRALSAVKGSAVGAVLGAPLGVAGHAIGRSAQHMLGARAAAAAETQDAPSGALMALNRSLERDRITPDDIIAQIRSEFPDDTATAGGRRFWGNRQPWTADQVEHVVRRAIDGETAQEISQGMRANGAGPGRQAVQTLLDEMENRHLGPLNLVDRAGMMRTGSGDNTQMTMRAAAATPGQAKAEARENLLERQVGSRDRMLNAIERQIGSTDFDGVLAQHEARMDAAQQAAYNTARQNEQPFDLQPILNRWTANYPPTRRGPIPEAVHSAIDAFVEHVPVLNQQTGAVVTHQLRPPQTLQQFIDARQNLLAEAMRLSPGVPKGRMLAMNDDRITPASRRIMGLRGELSAEVRRTNPDWGVANDLTRDGMAATEAAEAGARQALRLNAKSRDNLREYTEAQDLIRRGRQAGNQAMIDAGQARVDMFRVGLVRKIHDELANKPDTHNLTRELRLPSARHIIEEVLGHDDAARLYGVIDAEHAMHRTYSSQFGSQTTPLREAIDDLNWAPRLMSKWELLNPRKATEAAADWLASRVNAQRNQAMMPLLTETNPARQLDTLRAVQQVNQARQFGDNTVRRPLIASSGSASNASVAELLPKPRPDTSNESRYLSQARNAILRGADPRMVAERLRSLGIDPRKLN